ncbi:MAG: hypothetical protein JRI25_09830 [Deltaproteobacteria bacterium]|nr:hypothetical protein [Deltaproteobacteria bacterium]
MSEPPSNDLSLPEQEAGFLFRMEMWSTNAILGYWKHLVAVILVVLLAILVYGQYTSIHRRNQRGMTAEVSEVWNTLPAQAIPGQLTDEQKATLRTAADELARIGGEGGGPASAEAWLKAAELYRLLGETESQKAALVAAQRFARGSLLYAARSGVANIEMELGDPEAALATYRVLMYEMDGYLAQDAALSLGLAYEHFDRPSDARAVYTEFMGLWPDAPLASEVQNRLDRLGSRAAPEEAPSGEAPEEAPAEGVEAPEAPAEGVEAPEAPAEGVEAPEAPAEDVEAPEAPGPE